MNITLTPEQSQCIQGQLATGNYQSPTEILQVAFDLLAEQENQQDPQWLVEVGEKIDAAEASIARGEGVDFDSAMEQNFDRFQVYSMVMIKSSVIRHSTDEFSHISPN